MDYMNTLTKLVTLNEASKEIGVSIATIRTLIKTGHLCGMGFGTGKRIRYITRESLNAFGEIAPSTTKER